jgi:hypothetical protein
MSINKWLVREGLAIKFEPFARGRSAHDQAATTCGLAARLKLTGSAKR